MFVFPLYLFQSLSFFGDSPSSSMTLCLTVAPLHCIFITALFQKLILCCGSWFFSRWIVWTLFLFCKLPFCLCLLYFLCIGGGLNQTLFAYCNEMVYLSHGFLLYVQIHVLYLDYRSIMSNLCKVSYRHKISLFCMFMSSLLNTIYKRGCPSSMYIVGKLVKNVMLTHGIILNVLLICACF